MPHGLGAVAKETSGTHYSTALGYWAVELLLYGTTLSSGQVVVELVQYTAKMPWGIGPRDSGMTIRAAHCLIAWGQWGAVSLVQYTGALPAGKGQYHIPPLLCRIVMSSGSLARHGYIA